VTDNQRVMVKGVNYFGLFCLLFMAFPAYLQAQMITREKQESFPDILTEPLEILKSDVIPKGTFIRTNKDFILCRGQHFSGKPPIGYLIRINWNNKIYKNAGEWNNKIVAGINKYGSNRKFLKTALRKLQAGLNADPSFFPFLYNAGRICLLLRLPEKAIVYFHRTKNVMPAFSRIYLNMGHAYLRTGEDIAALKNYRLAFKKNPFDYAPLVAIGNYYLQKKSGTQAGYYFRKVLEYDSNYSNAKIGLGRLYIMKGETIKALILLKSIRVSNLDGSKRNDYDKSLHYYIAILSTKHRDYASAYRHFRELLKYPEDPFFLKVSILNIRRRMNIVRKLAEARGSSLGN